MTNLDAWDEQLRLYFDLKNWKEYRSAGINMAAAKQDCGDYLNALPMLIDAAVIDAMYTAGYTTGVDRQSISTSVQSAIVECARNAKITNLRLEELVQHRAERIAGLSERRRGELSDVIEDLVFSNHDGDYTSEAHHQGPTTDLPPLAESREWLDEPFKVKLNCGTSVSVASVHYARTYSGLLEGKPNKRVNAVVLKWIEDGPTPWGARRSHLVEPLLDWTHPSNPRLPPIVMRAWLVSNHPLNPAFCGSEAVVTWFTEECHSEAMSDIVLRGVRGLTWRKIAADFDY